MNKTVMVVAVAALFAGAVLAASNTAAPGQQKKAAAKTEAGEPATWEAAFRKADSDGNGGLSKAELDKTDAKAFPVIKQNFDRMDADRDGKVTVAERDAFLNAAEAKRAAAAPDPQKKADARTEAAERAGWEATFKKADSDGNGGLSKAELDKTDARAFPVIKQNFDRMDADRDGKVTIAERDAFVNAAEAKKAEKARK